MGRHKIKRECSFAPAYTYFSPNMLEVQGMMELNKDELEAIFLMDYQGLYQEAAALQMNISRPTLARIIKSARQKIATALIRGYGIHLSQAPDKFMVAIALDDVEKPRSFRQDDAYLAIVHVANQAIQSFHTIQNPFTSGNVCLKTALPLWLKEQHVNYWLSSYASEGLKNALLAKGIFFKKTTQLDSLASLPKLFCATI